jgi:hypothetical protein
MNLRICIRCRNARNKYEFMADDNICNYCWGNNKDVRFPFRDKSIGLHDGVHRPIKRVYY